jgi:glycosyltransferase involved in cell wall biosynthesis
MKTKVLHVLGGMGRGGAPIFIINNFLKMDKNKVQFDFLVRKDNCAFNEVLAKYNSKIYVVPEFPRNLFKNYSITKAIFKKYGSEYDVIHVHANALYYTLPFFFAKKYGIKKIILHSHNTQSNVGFLQPLHYLNRLFVSKLSNIFLACGQEAGKWMFGNKHFEVINNAVDVNKYSFKESFKTDIRNELGVKDDTTIIGSIGRFEEAKNHIFIIDIFNEYLRINHNSILVLLGDGSLRNNIQKKVIHLGLQNKVKFMGIRSDVEKFYSAMDIFLMPSLFEGLPFVMIEAQCAGLKCLVSENITSESIITDIVSMEKLDHSAIVWSEQLEKLRHKQVNRTSYSHIVSNMKYDIIYTSKRLFEIYTY